MRKIVLTLTGAIIFAWQGISFSADSSVDALIQKLEDKGILTDQEAAQIKDEVASSEQSSQQTTFKSLLPDWINSIKLTGDMRIRLQAQRRDDRSAHSASAGISNDRVRGRFRARLNLEDQVNDKFKVVFGIATDGYGAAGSSYGFNRSNNYSFGGNNSIDAGFGKDTVVVNKAYAKYTPWDTVTIMAGKMDNPIWEPQSSFLWDPNITPEGGAIQLQKKINDLFTPWATAEFDVIQNDTPTSQDVWMTAIQAGSKGNLTDKVYYKAAANYYNIQDPTQGTINSLQRSLNLTNTTNAADSTYVYTFDSIYGGTVELGMNDPFGDLLDIIPTTDWMPHPYIPQIGVFGSYITNPGASHDNADNAAWQMGWYMGNSALNGWGTWKFNSAYKVIERDAWLDVFPDYDFYTGDTDVAGWRNEIDIGLMKNVYFSFQVYDTRIYKPFVNGDTTLNSGTTSHSTDQPAREILTQADLNVVF